jgi:hypothetical protein
MNPWPWPTSSLAIRPFVTTPRRSGGGDTAALFSGAVFRAAL